MVQKPHLVELFSCCWALSHIPGSVPYPGSCPSPQALSHIPGPVPLPGLCRQGLRSPPAAVATSTTVVTMSRSGEHSQGAGHTSPHTPFLGVLLYHGFAQPLTEDKHIERESENTGQCWDRQSHCLSWLCEQGLCAPAGLGCHSPRNLEVNPGPRLTLVMFTGCSLVQAGQYGQPRG